MKSGRSSIRRWTCPSRPYGSDIRTSIRRESGNWWTGNCTMLGTEARKVFTTGGEGHLTTGKEFSTAPWSIRGLWTTWNVRNPLTGRGNCTVYVKFAKCEELKAVLSLFCCWFFCVIMNRSSVDSTYIFLIELVNVKCSWKMLWFKRRLPLYNFYWLKH